MKTKVQRAEAMRVGHELVGALGPCCDRIEICGSLRRGKEFVSDVELVFVPKFADSKEDMFKSILRDMAEEKIELMKQSGVIEPRLNKLGHATWGPRNKLAVHCASGVAVDLFSVSEENWWVSLVVRTGSKETNLKLTTGAQKLGRSLNAYGSGVTITEGPRNGEIVPATSERHVFDLCGVNFLLPEDR